MKSNGQILDSTPSDALIHTINPLRFTKDEQRSVPHGEFALGVIPAKREARRLPQNALEVIHIACSEGKGAAHRSFGGVEIDGLEYEPHHRNILY